VLQIYPETLICLAPQFRTSSEMIMKNDYELKSGPKKKLNSRYLTRIKREISILKSKNQRVTAPKLKYKLQLNVNERTIQRRLKEINFSYRNAPKLFPSRKEHREKRMKRTTPG